MAIFGKLQIESVIQAGDKTRLNSIDSFVSKDESAITLVRIRPLASGSFIDVTGVSSDERYLDWAYTSEAIEIITLEITTNGPPELFTETISVLSETTDKLFSSDSDLVEIEDDILSYVRRGRSSFLDKHRQAQKRIIDSLDRRRVFDEKGNRLTKNDLFSLEEIKQWSTYLTLQIIFESLRVEPGDIYSQKSDTYRSLSNSSEHTAVIRLDTDEDGNEDSLPISLMSGALRRR